MRILVPLIHFLLAFLGEAKNSASYSGDACNYQLASFLLSRRSAPVSTSKLSPTESTLHSSSDERGRLPLFKNGKMGHGQTFMTLTIVQRISAFGTAGEICLCYGVSSCISSSIDMKFFLQPSLLIFQQKGEVSSSAKSSLGHVFLALAVVRRIMAYDAFGEASVMVSSLSHLSSSKESSKYCSKLSSSYLSSYQASSSGFFNRKMAT